MYTEGNTLMANWELRANARKQLSQNWPISVMTALIFTLMNGILGSIPILGWFLTGPLMLGLCKFFIKLKRGNDARIDNVFEGFNYFGSSAILQFVIIIFSFLWSLLLIVPGIIAYLSYSQAFFILNDNPDMQPMDALRHSKNMMRGFKGKLFLLYLSFFGWGLLASLTFGIGYFWLLPYMQATMANFYDNLKESTSYSFI